MLLPSIHFNGNCNEAITFYKEALGATVKEIHYAKDAPADAEMGELPQNFVMHSEIELFGITCALTDGAKTPITSEHHCFTLLLDTDEEVKNVWDKLSDGGKVIDPLEPQFWATLSGYVQDKFGVNWSINTRA